MPPSAERSDLGVYAVGQAAVDYEQRIDWHSLRGRRVNRARDEMERAGLDAVLVWKDENVRFLSGLRPQIIQGKSALLNGCLLRRDGKMTLFLSGGEVDRVRLTMPWVEDVRPVPIMEAQGLIAGAYDAAIAPAVRVLELDTARIGIDEIAFAQLAEVNRTLPEVRLCDGDAVMQAARMRKDQAELAAMQEASAIAEALTEAAITAVGPGVREYEVVAAAMSQLYRLGGEMAHLATPFVASGERLSPPQRFASDKVIREGDLVFIDIGAMWNGYFSDMGPGGGVREAVSPSAGDLYGRSPFARRRARCDATRQHQSRCRPRGGRRWRGARLWRPVPVAVHRPWRRHGGERAAVCRRAAPGCRDRDA